MAIKLAVCIPTHGSMMTKTAVNVMFALTKFRHPVIILSAEHGTIFQARTALAEEALRLEATHLLWLDCDIVPPTDALKRLFSQDKAIIGCNYLERHTPPQVATVKPLGTVNGNGLQLVAIPKTLFKAAAMGMGFVLTKATVFQTIPKPWFAFETNEQGDFMSEDVYFFNKAREYGFTVWCDPTIDVKHLGSYAY